MQGDGAQSSISEQQINRIITLVHISYTYDYILPLFLLPLNCKYYLTHQIKMFMKNVFFRVKMDYFLSFYMKQNTFYFISKILLNERLRTLMCIILLCLRD